MTRLKNAFIAVVISTGFGGCVSTQVVAPQQAQQFNPRDDARANAAVLTGSGNPYLQAVGAAAIRKAGEEPIECTVTEKTKDADGKTVLKLGCPQ